MQFKEGSLAEKSASLLSGLFTGFLAGLIGVGGAEERVWFLFSLLAVPLRPMFLINLLISLLTSSSSFTIRLIEGVITQDALTLAVTMIITSPIGAYLGGILSFRAPERGLRYFLAAILTIVSLEFFYEVYSGLPRSILSTTALGNIALAAVFGFLIGIIAGMIGVAGGEYRIPVFIFIFGIDIKAAGTASSLVAIPTVVAAILRHGRKLKLSPRERKVASWMAIGSFAGVVIGVLGLIFAPSWLIRIVFAMILLYTAYTLVAPPLNLNQTDTKRSNS